MMFYTQKNNQGFSLVETLVAISILLIVIVGPMSISMRTAKSASFASEQIQAFFLAQEGLELAQKGRDDLMLRNFLPSADPSYISNPWARFTSTSAGAQFENCFNAAGCGLQWHATTNGALATPVSCATVTNCLLYRDTSGRSWFSHVGTGATPTIFTRRIYFTNVSSGVAIRSEVTWRTGSLVVEQKVEVDTYLYNIYGTP
jgi:prepilin-type N-terminal cleavage/methylation domain-containing protein